LDTTQTVAGMPPDTIASQSIAAGTKLDRNATVHVVVNSGVPVSTAPPAGTGPLVSLPSVAGLEYTAALQALIAAGFQYSVRYVQQSTNNGKILAQDPPPGQSPQGTTVEVTLSVPGEVPDTNGMYKAEAIKTLSENGYSVAKWEYTTTAGADGKVVGTDPPAGTTLAPGSSVSVTVNGTSPL
jgi:serine/threonine-protein kinase